MWFFLLFLFFIFPTSSLAFDLQQSESVKIFASIGENEVTIFGHTSPNSKVELTGVNIYSLTFSQNDGYFEFNKIILPKNPSELCLQTKDNYDRNSTLVCIPPPPAANYHTDIGPIILPPTISLEQDKINPNSTIITSGQSIPNSPITIFFYKVNDAAKSFPKTALAYSLPPLKAVSDDNGDYSLNLPTAYSSNYRLYTSVEYDGNNSPKSNTLLYFLPSLFWLFLMQHTYLMVLLPIFIFTLILFFLLLFFNSNTYHRISRLRFLPALRTYYPAIKTQHFPHVYPDVLPRALKIAK
ncbi:MAG: hypothetical protein PHE32_00775 [Candidatus Shapirobacteria bacterium]|nr:hypothetical protein [Candidatus Shapirobacteria bacterium]